jgi:predicted  nucleic acid-binding Zn-ribbon protein
MTNYARQVLQKELDELKSAQKHWKSELACARERVLEVEKKQVAATSRIHSLEYILATGDLDVESGAGPADE